MKQFYETYQGNKKLSTLLTEIGWSNHLHIIAKTKDDKVVKYAMNRNMSPTMIAEYETK